MFHFTNALLSTGIFSNDSPVGMFVDRLENDPMLQMLTAFVVMVIAAAVILAVIGAKKKPPGGEPDPEVPGIRDDDPHAGKDWREDPIYKGPASGDDETAGRSTSSYEEPEAYTKSREAVNKGLFLKKPDFKDSGEFKTADPAPAYSGLKMSRMGGSGYETAEKDNTPSEVETFYTYNARVNVGMCPYCGCENSVAAERCGCCGEYII